MRSSKRWIAAAVALGVGLGGTTKAEAGGLFGKSSGKADHSGHAHQHGPKDHVHQAAAQMPEGTVVSVTPIYPPGEEPGKASFDGTRSDAPVGRQADMRQASHVTGEPAPIGIVQTNYNNPAANPAARMPAQVDVMAHGKSAGGQQGMMPPGMVPPGMMPPGMIPPGQTPGTGVKARRGLLGKLIPSRPSANDPYAVFKMSKSQRAMHAATPLGPQAQGPVTSLPPSAVYGGPNGHSGH